MYWLVMSSEGKVLACYGRALLEDAEKLWERLMPFARLVMSSKRYRIGDVAMERDLVCCGR